MNIAQGLKEKNRISGRISKLQSQVYSSNKFTDKKVPDVYADKLLIKLQEEWAHLIDLKTRLAKANVGVCDKLVLLTETKAELHFWNSFRYTGQQTEIEDDHEYVGDKYVKVEKKSYHTITSAQVLENQERVQSLIEKLQDEIDSYNATTSI
jgi:hypothetical protein